MFMYAIYRTSRASALLGRDWWATWAGFGAAGQGPGGTVTRLETSALSNNVMQLAEEAYRPPGAMSRAKWGSWPIIGPRGRKGPSVLYRICAIVWLGCLLGVADAARAGNLLSALEAHRAVSAGELVLVDVRSEREWHRTGLPAGAVPITIHQAGGSKAFYEAVLEAVDGDKARPTGLICAGGVRSHRAMQILRARGFERLNDVAEGMEGSAAGPGWRRRQLPLAAFDGGRIGRSPIRSERAPRD